MSDCTEVSRQTTFTASRPSFMGSANSNGLLQSDLAVGFAEEKHYEVWVASSFAPEPSLGVSVSAVVNVNPVGGTEAHSAPLGGYVEVGAELRLRVTNAATGDLICADEQILDRRSTSAFATTRSFRRASYELSCAGPVVPGTGSILAVVTLHTWGIAGAFAWGKAHAEVNVNYIALERCCVRPLEAPSGMIPLFGWYSNSRKDNFATSQPSWAGCRGATRQPDYGFSRCEGFVFDPRGAQPAGTVPIYSWWNPLREDNFITSDPRWSLDLDAVRGDYRRFRLEGFVYDPKKPQPAGTAPLYSWWHGGRQDNFATTDPRYTNRLPVADIEWIGEHISNGPSTETGYKLYRNEGFVLL